MVREMASTLPPGLYDEIMQCVSVLPVNVTIQNSDAKSFAGLFIAKGDNATIKISSSYTGVRYFLTLTHEIAHLLVWVKYGLNRIDTKPHGKEWKNEYKSLVLRFLGKGYYSIEIESAILTHMINPPYSTKLHIELLKVLTPDKIPLRDIRCGTSFRMEGYDGLLFVKTQQRYSTVTFKSTFSGELFTVHKNYMVLKNS